MRGEFSTEDDLLEALADLSEAYEGPDGFCQYASDLDRDPREVARRLLAAINETPESAGLTA